MDAGEVADLVTRAREGDERAWADLVQRYLGMVHAICPVSYTHLTLPTIYSV